MTSISGVHTAFIPAINAPSQTSLMAEARQAMLDIQAALDAKAAKEYPVQAARPAAALVSPQTLLLAQEMGQADEQDTSSALGQSAVGKSAEEAFLEYQNMTPAEKYRAMYLSQLGLTEEDLAGMSADERAKVEAKLAEMIRAAIERDLENGTDETA